MIPQSRGSNRLLKGFSQKQGDTISTEFRNMVEQLQLPAWASRAIGKVHAAQ